nr:hypothetical protein BaRGS_000449 [Batillaria attramentaria]
MGDIYLDMPVNRQQIQDRKMAKLQQQIAALENQLKENTALRRQLEGINEAEKERAQHVIDRINSRNMVLKDEIDRIYHHKSPVNSPSPSQLVEDVISHRTKEFSELQHEKALQIKYLMAEKQRLQLAQEQLRQKRLAMHRMPTPEGEVSTRRPSAHSVHSTTSLLHRTVQTMPNTVDRIWQLKEELRYDYDTRRKPYRGELGVDSYEAWQIEDYVFVRKVVEEIVDDFIAKYIPPDYGYVEGDVRWAMQHTQNKEWVQTSEALSERKAVQLVAEEILLQETRSVMRQAAAEVVHVHGTFKNMTDILMMREAERITTGKEEGREPTEPAYNLITKSYFTQQQNRNKHRRDVWNHSQYLHLSAATRAKREPLEDVGTDVEVISFNHLHPTDLQKFKAGQFDLPNAKRRKQCSITYRKREAEFWTGMEPGLFSLDLASSCGGVQCMRPSPDHTFVAVGTVHGDVLVYDVRVEPWRVVRVIHNAAGADDNTVDISWSLDGTRLISVNQGGSLVAWSMEGPPVNKKELRGLSVQPDDHGNLPKQLGRLAVLDVDNGDFSFQMGPLAESEVLTDKFGPVKGVFFPQLLSFWCTVCAVLENGDVMKVNLEPLSAADSTGGEMTFPDAPCIYQPNVYDESHGVNLVGQNLEAELFRQHQVPIIFIGFVDNISRLVTVDEEGYINLWKYDP